VYDKYGSPIGYDAWTNVVRLIEWVCANWQQPDEGIWEVRGGRQEFLYSRVMCWVAIDRAIRLANKRSFPAPLARWHETRDTIYQDVFTRFWDPTRRAFIQHVGATTLDAAALLMPLVRFVSPTDPRWISTLRAIERELVSDSLVYRYRLTGGFSDGLTGEEGTFSMCSFWYVECLSRMGDLHKARFPVIGIAPAERAETFRAAWREAAASFRPLTASERRAIRETRVRIVGARHGETIGGIVGV